MTASTESEMLGKFVVPFDLGRPLVDRATQGFIHDPLQQIRCADCVAEFLQCHRESILAAVTVDLFQNRRGCERAALDCQGELHELGVVLIYQRPVDRARKQ